MFLEQVKSIFGDFASRYEFLVKIISDNYILFIANDFDIIVSYDNREDEIYIDFDLSRYFKIKEYSHELKFPVLLNIDNVCKHLEIPISDFIKDRSLSLEERVNLKFKQLIIVWNYLIQNKNYKDILSNILVEERIELKKYNELQNLKSIIAKAHDLFKTREYEKTIELLGPHIEKLGEHDKKILEYSLKKTGSR